MEVRYIVFNSSYRKNWRLTDFVQSIFKFSSFYCNNCDLFYCNVLNNNNRSHMQSLTAMPIFCWYYKIGSVVFSWECSEHELTWLALENIIWRPTLLEKAQHLCMWDERIRRDTCQNFLHKTPHSVTSEQCHVLVPSFCGLRMEHLGPIPPF